MSTWEDNLVQQENVDGVRFSWNIRPHSRIDARRLVVPTVAFFTPLKERPEDAPQQPPLEYDLVLCQKPSCKAVLNTLCQCDFRAKMWICALCAQRNTFPAHYSMISEENRPPELHPQFTTIEYTLRKATTMLPIFLYVVDTCLTSEELHALKESLQECPEKCLARARPGAPTPVGLPGGPAGGHAAPHPTYHKFLQTISECDESINNLISPRDTDR